MAGEAHLDKDLGRQRDANLGGKGFSLRVCRWLGSPQSEYTCYVYVDLCWSMLIYVDVFWLGTLEHLLYVVVISIGPWNS